MSFSEFLDVAWAHLLSQCGAMSNPFEYREVMKAAFGYSDKTVDEVLADQKARHDAESRSTRPAARKGRRAPSEPSTAKPRQSEVDKLKALLAGGIQKPAVTSE